MMPLTMATVGESNCIRKITGKDEIRQHLAELGFVIGANVTVLSQLGGNMILSIKGSRIGLDKTVTSRIMI